MKLKKLLCLLLCLLFVLGSFVACAGNVDPLDSGTTAPAGDSGDADDAATKFLDIAKDGVVANVVYSMRAGSDIVTVVNSMVSTLKSITGVSMMPKAVSGASDPKKVEIVIGETDYEESKQVFDEVGYGEGIVRVVGNKVIVAAYDANSYNKALSRFSIALNNGKYGEGNKNIRIEKTYSVNVAEIEEVADLPLVKGMKPADIKNAGDGCYLLTFDNSTEANVNGYLTTLTEHGYTKHASKPIDNNTYYTYHNGTNVVTVAYTDYNKEMKVAIEKLSNTGLAPTAEQNVWTPVSGLTSTITQVGLYYDYEETSKEEYVNGMSYVVRLKDGSFILVDGGHDTPEVGDRLYNVMKKQAPNPDKIVIAAWLFTHGHGDHTGFFASFCEKYASKVTVERFIYNFPAPKEMNDNGTDFMSSLLGRYFPNTPSIKSHPGQVYHLRNAELTVLYTNDLFEYRTETMKTSNQASMVFQIALEGKKFMVFGDYYYTGPLLKLYSNATLKSAIMQVIHHGISHNSLEICQAVTPEYALWPVGAETTMYSPGNDITQYPMNSYMKNNMDSSKVFMARDDMVILTLNNGSISAQKYENYTAYMNS